MKRISNQYNLNESWRLHKDDSKSVHRFAEANLDKVAFYQPEIKKDDVIVQEFLLVFISERQLKYMQKKKNFRVICVDATHNVGAKKKMATIMTVDEDEEGVALAFCFCDSESAATMQMFFDAVKKKIGFKIETSTFLSDDANAFYNAWCAVMSTTKPVHKRLCAWHVNKNWIAYLNQVSNEAIEPEELDKFGNPITKRSKCKSKLFSLRCELDINVLGTKMENFLEFLKSDEDYKKFGDYFTKTYAKRVEQWAYAYLQIDGGYNTNMYLEAWHRVFKYKYLSGIEQHRLDYVIHQLIKFDEDEKEEELRRKNFVVRSNKKSSNVLKCHKRAHEQSKQLIYNIKTIHCPEEDGVAKFVFENLKQPITVTQHMDDSLHKCIYTCRDCNTCPHRFSCSFSEHRIRRNYCVHLCALGLDKKLLFGFSKMETNQDLSIDYGDCGGYETDDAPEIKEMQMSEMTSKETPKTVQEKLSALEKINLLTKQIQAEAIHAVTSQPDREEEFCEYMTTFLKTLKQAKRSNINQIAQFENKKGKRKAIENQIRRSPKKKKH